MDVVETGGAPGDRALDVAELPLLEVVYSLGEIVSCEVEERQERRPHSLGTVLHNGSVRSHTNVSLPQQYLCNDQDKSNVVEN